MNESKKFRVYLEAVASHLVVVEANDMEEAIDKAIENAPTAAWDWPNLGEWYFPGYDGTKYQRQNPEDYVDYLTGERDE